MFLFRIDDIQEIEKKKIVLRGEWKNKTTIPKGLIG